MDGSIMLYDLKNGENHKMLRPKSIEGKLSGTVEVVNKRIFICESSNDKGYSRVTEVVVDSLLSKSEEKEPEE